MHAVLLMGCGAILFCLGAVVGGLLNEVGHHTETSKVEQIDL